MKWTRMQGGHKPHENQIKRFVLVWATGNQTIRSLTAQLTVSPLLQWTYQKLTLYQSSPPPSILMISLSILSTYCWYVIINRVVLVVVPERAVCVCDLVFGTVLFCIVWPWAHKQILNHLSNPASDPTTAVAPLPSLFVRGTLESDGLTGKWRNLSSFVSFASGA